MIIVFSKTLRVEAEDGVNFTVQRKKVAKSGKHKGQVWWDTEGYHHTLEQAALRILQLAVHDPKVKLTVSALLAALDKSTTVIAKACELAGGAFEAAKIEGIVNDGTADELFDVVG
jgi:hypothetical protein